MEFYYTGSGSLPFHLLFLYFEGNAPWKRKNKNYLGITVANDLNERCLLTYYICNLASSFFLNLLKRISRVSLF